MPSEATARDDLCTGSRSDIFRPQQGQGGRNTWLYVAGDSRREPDNKRTSNAYYLILEALIVRTSWYDPSSSTHILKDSPTTGSPNHCHQDEPAQRDRWSLDSCRTQRSIRLQRLLASTMHHCRRASLRRFFQQPRPSGLRCAHQWVYLLQRWPLCCLWKHFPSWRHLFLLVGT